MKADNFIITPSASGVRVVVNGVSFFRPFTPAMLINMGLRFIEAARETHRRAGTASPDVKHFTSSIGIAAALSVGFPIFAVMVWQQYFLNQQRGLHVFLHQKRI